MPRFSSPPPAPDAYVPSPIEAEYFEALWQVADAHFAQRSGKLAGNQAVAFLNLSGVAKNVLRAVWSVADSKALHFLTKADFFVAMRLIAMAQRGLTITASEFSRLGNTPLPLPRFTGLPAALNVDKALQWEMTSDERSKYESLFSTYDSDGDGFIHGQVGKHRIGLFYLRSLFFVIGPEGGGREEENLATFGIVNVAAASVSTSSFSSLAVAPT